MDRFTFLLRWDNVPLQEFLIDIKRFAGDIERHKLSHSPAIRRSKHYAELKTMFPAANTDRELLHLLSAYLKSL